MKSLATSFIVVKVGETAAREGLNYAADALSHFAMEQFKPQISDHIQQKVMTNFSNTTFLALC